MTLCGSAAAAEGQLRVCADPTNLPYSTDEGAGFENRIAALVAAEIGVTYSPVWLPQGRGYVRKTINEGLCDVIAGVPADLDLLRTTVPYYRSAYVFVFRSGVEAFRSFDDPRLKALRVGVQLIGDDLAATPPGHALAARGVVDNVRGYTVYGDRPQVQRMIDDVAEGVIDVAVAWGPQAGYFASHAKAPLTVTIAEPPPALAQIPFAYSISMGVRKRDSALQQALDAAISRLQPQIDAVLAEYNVPRVETRGHAELAR